MQSIKTVEHHHAIKHANTCRYTQVCAQTFNWVYLGIYLCILVYTCVYWTGVYLRRYWPNQFHRNINAKTSVSLEITLAKVFQAGILLYNIFDIIIYFVLFNLGLSRYYARGILFMII